MDFSFFDYLEIFLMLKSDNKDSLRTLSWSENVELKKKDCELVKKKLDSSLKFIVYIAKWLGATFSNKHQKLFKF